MPKAQTGPTVKQIRSRELTSTRKTACSTGPPTDLEIAEAEAFGAFVVHPFGEPERAWMQSHLRLMNEEGSPTVCRCPNCFLILRGVGFGDACQRCGRTRQTGEGSSNPAHYVDKEEANK